METAMQSFRSITVLKGSKRRINDAIRLIQTIQTIRLDVEQEEASWKNSEYASTTPANECTLSWRRRSKATWRHPVETRTMHLVHEYIYIYLFFLHFSSLFLVVPFLFFYLAPLLDLYRVVNV